MDRQVSPLLESSPGEMVTMSSAMLVESSGLWSGGRDSSEVCSFHGILKADPQSQREGSGNVADHHPGPWYYFLVT